MGPIVILAIVLGLSIFSVFAVTLFLEFMNKRSQEKRERSLKTGKKEW